jgi:para-nitrobenzyl esterase
VPEPAPTAAAVPMMICSVETEQAPAWTDASLMTITLPEVAEKLKQRAGFGPGLGDKAMDVVNAYAKAYPDKKPVEIWSLVSSNRSSVVALADAKSKQSAPVFVTWFAWQPPLFDGRIGAFHCVDICFWFKNTDLMYTHTGGGARPRRLSDKMAASLVQFMKTGDPNGAGLTSWPKYSPARGETLVWNDTPAVQNDPDRVPRQSIPRLT